MAPRPTGSAVILVDVDGKGRLDRIPVRVYPGTGESPRISFTSMCTEHAAKLETLQRCTVDRKVFEKPEKEGAPIPGISKAYAMGQTLLALTDEELEEVQPKTDPIIVILATVDLEDVDPIHWTGQVQYLGPDVGTGPVTNRAAARGYSRLADSLVEASSGPTSLGVGRWATRGNDRLVGIYAKNRRLVLQGLRRPGEVRDIEELEPVEEVPWDELADLTKALTRIRVEKLDLSLYPDERYEKTKKLLGEKVAKLLEAPRKVPRRARAAK